MDRILSPDELAPLIRCSPGWIRAACRRGEIRGQKVGGKWLVNTTQEWPGLFGPREDFPVPSAGDRAGERDGL